MTDNIEERPILDAAEESLAPESAEPTQTTAPEPSEGPRPSPKPEWLHRVSEEKERRKEAEARASRLENEMAVGNQRLQEMLAEMARTRAAEAAPPEPVLPDVERDPVGHFKAVAAEHQKKLSELYRKQQGLDQQTEAQRQQQTFTERYQGDAASYARSQPEFFQAYSFVSKGMYEDLTEAGFSPQQAQMQLNNLERQIATTAWQNNKSAGEALYRLALKRGYKAQMAEKAAPAQDKQPTGEEEIEYIERGQRQASRSLSGGNASNNPFQGLTLSRLASMSSEEYARVPAAIRQKALGR